MAYHFNFGLDLISIYNLGLNYNNPPGTMGELVISSLHLLSVSIPPFIRVFKRLPYIDLDIILVIDIDPFVRELWEDK